MLLSQYPQIIAEMPETFTSIEFIITLARENQTEYIESLYSYRKINSEQDIIPFIAVHTILARFLKAYPNLIELVQSGVSGTDMLGQSITYEIWKKVEPV
jgi:hypothetical protein